MRRTVGKVILLDVLEHLRQDWFNADKEDRYTIENCIDELLYLYKVKF